MKAKKITERGWAGHFICADRCTFRRNTLLDFGRKKIIISTVGMMRDNEKDGNFYTIGAGGRYYETMAFHAKKEGPYWDIDVSRQISFKSEWAICAGSLKELPRDADNKANDMHDTVVSELSGQI
jgi:hypothetical protein